MNETQVTMFRFSGLTQDPALSIFLFIFFLLVYMITVVGNVGLFIIVYRTSTLHTPMYYFLSHLSVVDLFYSSAVTPKMIVDLIFLEKVITFNGCALQFFVFSALAGTEVLLLSSMSYDRYAAICHPLHYVSIMTKRKCLGLVLGAFAFGFFQSSVQTICLFSLWYCGSWLIDHFYCDVPPLLKLSCSRTFTCEMVNIFLIGSCGFFSLALILCSYIFIITSILRIRSGNGRQKAFSTCSSHVICASIFYVSVFLTYFHSSSNVFEEQDKVAAIFYSIMTPMLNPLIYSLRNQEVRKGIAQVLHSIGCLVTASLSKQLSGTDGGGGGVIARSVQGAQIGSNITVWDIGATILGFINGRFK
ncbi:olfactory receptor 5B12-like [Dendropsophus ebraccatus]|uniref:olfactory receptor 5B12-like n=1 Tax=Dendropsophus ebraccatus TaxID=150705 RepID=UPI003831D1B1